MRNYEIVVIVQPDLDETALTAVLEKIKGWITDAGGSIEKVEPWGKRRMAYTIRKLRDGQYVLIRSQMAPAFMVELERNLRLLEPVMRFLITSAD
jgi:small subunit ribosomal protein S6